MTADATRIVQVLDRESACVLLSAFGGSAGQLLVGIDDKGQFWRFGADGGLARDWHRLPLPPLPGGES